ncbi:MAG: hypothetical protein HC836_38300 [Richelia sp. RM2_1_2]|nr:hypothetical protein [Richelia sp. SM1_7_0]NJO63831.1 hypothetical protein [Richelia sp. RM2_1_2]
MSSSSIDILIVLEEPKRNSKNTIFELDQILNDYGIVIEVGALYYLNDYGEEEFDPEDIVDAKDTLNKLVNWPTAGWLEYHMPGCSLLISYKTDGDFLLSGIYISAYESEYNSQKEKLDKLIYFLHYKYKSLRTIKGENIFEDFDPEDEIERVRNGIFEGNYQIDLR